MNKTPIKKTSFIKYAVFLIIVLCAFPAVAGAQSATTSPQNTSVTGGLIAPRPMCWFRFENDLRFGLRDVKNNIGAIGDVTQLQTFLKSEGFLKAEATGYFGGQTLAAVKKYQKLNNIPATGFVGPLTRAQLHKAKGCPTDELTVLDITGPSQINVNQQGTWTVSVRNQGQSQLMYSVDWGDRPMYTSPQTASQSTQPPVLKQQTSSFTHTYTDAGTYTLTFFVYDGDNTFVYARKSMQITVVNPNAPRITVTSPNGGESWKINSVETLRWSIANNVNPNTRVDIYLQTNNPTFVCPPNAYCPIMLDVQYVLDKNIVWNYAYPWIVGTDMDNKPIPRGSYKLRVCEAGSTSNCDESNVFNLVDLVYEANRSPVINGFTGPTTLRVGETGNWNISAYDPEGEMLTYSTSWTKVGGAMTVGVSGTDSSVYSKSFSEAGEYRFQFKVQDRVGKTAEVQTTVTVQN